MPRGTNDETPASFFVDRPEDLIAEIQCFVAEFINVPIERVYPSTRLSEDLGVDGDDADELMDAFAEQFGVDLTDFRHNEHFGDEGCLQFSTVLLLLPSVLVFTVLWNCTRWAGGVLASLVLIALIARGMRGYPHSITIQDLANAAMAKHWNYPYSKSG
ncbi:MAG: hypothetical protein Rubg2KO_32090 [Rubricoccaceae bacterium]